MNLLVYRASSWNGVLTRMATSLAAALSDLGHAVSTVSLSDGDWAQAAVRTIGEKSIDHVISLGSFGADLTTADGRSAYDALGCGFVGWDVDHPAYQYKRFAAPIAQRLQVNASVSHGRFAVLMGCRAGERLMVPGVDAVAADPLPLAERPIPVAVAMTWLGEPVVWWAGTKGTPVYGLIEGIVGRVLADPDADLTVAYEGAVADTGLALRLDESVCNLVANVGLFVRQYDRWRLAQALAAMDIPCTIRGGGWRERLGERAHLTYEEDQAAGPLYGRARVVLNLNAANGASERAVEAMAAGAVTVSDTSPLLRAQFEGAVRTFDRRDPAGLADALGAALASGEAQAMADRGRALVAREHLWAHKAARLAEALRAS